MRNLALLTAAPTVFFYMLTIFIYAQCVYDAFMIQVLDQMMTDMFLRPLLLLLVFFNLLLFYRTPSPYASGGNSSRIDNVPLIS